MAVGIVSYFVFFISLVMIFGIVAMGLNLQWGFTGLFNAGIAGFYAVGAYTHAIITTPPLPGFIANQGLPWIVGIVAAMAVTALAAWIIGLATIKLRGDYLAISSFGIATTIQLVTLNWESLTGGSQGMSRIPKPMASMFDTPFSFNLFFMFLLVVIVLAIYWALERIVHSPWGRVLKAIREDEVAAVALGKSAQRFRMQSFIIGSTLMGLAGALYVSYIGFVSPFDFLPIFTFQIWAMVIVGGSGNNKGALLGALVIWAIWAMSGVAVTKIVPASYAAQGAAIQVILIGLMLVLSLLFRPRGLIGEKQVIARTTDD